LRLTLPHSGLDHPLSQGLFTYLDLMTLGQLFGGECRPKIAFVSSVTPGASERPFTNDP
jgi:hypothetical protein